MEQKNMMSIGSKTIIPIKVINLNGEVYKGYNHKKHTDISRYFN